MPSSSEGSGGRRATALPVDPRFCPNSLGGGGRGATALPLGHAGRVTQPLVSGRWRVLGAASRRAIASRKAVPADVKEPISFP